MFQIIPHDARLEGMAMNQTEIVFYWRGTDGVLMKTATTPVDEAELDQLVESAEDDFMTEWD